MDIATLSLFRETVLAGSFAEAARRAEVDPSQVSRAIAALERDLGVRLFERSTRRIALTEAGALYADRILPLLDDLQEAGDAARDLSQAPRGRLRVSASTAFGERIVVPMLSDFLSACPEVSVDLLLSDAAVDLVAERIDVAIRLSPEAPPDIIVSRLMDTNYRVVAAPGLHVPNHPNDLADISCLRFALPGFRSQWKFTKGDETFDVPIAGRVEVLGASALAEAARRGLGPALLADWLIAEDLAAGRLVDLFPDWQVAAAAPDTAAWLLMPSRAYRPLKTRRFVDALRAAVGNRKD